MVTIRTFLCSALCASLLSAIPALAAMQAPTAADARYELSLLSGYGITHRGFGDTRTQVQTFDAIARLGWYLSDELGTGTLQRAVREFLGRHPQVDSFRSGEPHEGRDGATVVTLDP